MSNGEWQKVLDEHANPLNTDSLAMHAALLPTGQVLYFGGSERREDQHNAGPRGWNHARIWTPDNGHVDAIPSPGWDLFCCGHCFLGSGQLLVIGGTEGYADEGGPIHGPHSHLPGLRNAAKFDAALVDQAWQNEQVVHPPQAGTGWTDWYAHGLAADRAKQFIVLQHDDGRLHAFMIGIDGRLRHNEQIAFAPLSANPGQTWTGWNALVTVDNRAKYLTVAKHADGRMHAFMIGTDDQVWHIAQTLPVSPGSDWNAQWAPFSAIGNRAKYLTIARQADGRLHAFIIGMDNQAYRNEQITSGWTAWQKLSSVGDNTARFIIVARHADGRLHAFKVGVDDPDQVSHIAQTSPVSPGSGWNTQWSPFSAAGNRAKYLTVAQHADGRLHAFMIGMDNHVWRNEQTSSSWTTWQKLSSIGDNTARSIVVARHADGRLHAFKIGVDNQVSHIAQTSPVSPGSGWNTQWSPFSAVGDRAKYLTVAQHADGRLHAFMIGMDNQVWHNEQNASAWTGWTTLSSAGDRAKSLVAATDADGRLHAFAIGINRSPWVEVPPMLAERNRVTGGGRWYPTPVTLFDGRVAVMGGHPSSLDSRHSNFMVELFDPSSNAWQDAGDEPASVITARPSEKPEIYPRLHALPNGDVFCVALADERSWLWNPASRFFVDLNAPVPSEMQLAQNFDQNLWASVLLPLRWPNYYPRILVAGGMQHSYIFDFMMQYSGWQQKQRDVVGFLGAPYIGVPPIRMFASLVLLPDSTVVMVGGTRNGDDDLFAVLDAELFDPATNTWKRLAPATVARQYHSTALLLPDGRVWTGGSNIKPGSGQDREERMEIFSPPYLFNGPRPTIVSAPDNLVFNLPFTVYCSNPNDISQVVLVRCGSATHGFDADQRLVELHIDSRASASMVVKAPPNGYIAPPGYYMLFALSNAGVPSHAPIVRLGMM